MNVTPRTAWIEHDPWNSQDDLLLGRFCFLHHTADLGRPVRWNPEDEPLLWRFNLHYFNWLHLLAPVERDAVCSEWVESNPVGTPVAWHPYPTSLRIVNWCKADLTSPALLESLYTQAAWLSRNLETHVYGNHLIENARALVIAGSCFGTDGEAPEWLEKGLSILDSELQEQILDDGCHFERSPMYQALMLEAVLDVVNVLGKVHPSVTSLVDVAVRMSAALQAMTHPDGEIALLNDSTLEIAPATAKLTGYADRLLESVPAPSENLPDAGYHIAKGPGLYLIMDAGPPGPDYLLAHAHADIFSFELSLGGKRFVVDPGVYEYAAGEMRDYVRSTHAHSTVAVDGIDQIECWGSFRVGRRSTPQDVEFRTDNDMWVVSGSFSGFDSVIGGGVVHRRSIHVDGNDGMIRVRDRVEGTGRHRVSSRIHLHPDVRVEDDGRRLVRDNVSCRLLAGDRKFETERGWFCPEFGRRIQSTVLLLEDIGELPIELEYTIHFDPEALS